MRIEEIGVAQPSIKPYLIAVVLFLLVAVSAFAVTEPAADSPLADKAFRAPDLYISHVYTPAAELPPTLAATRVAQLTALGVAGEHGFVDRRTGAWGTLILSTPLVPGTGNSLSWVDVGVPAPGSTAQLEAAAFGAFESFLQVNAASLGVPLDELGTRSITAVSDGQVVQIHVGQAVDGVPVRGGFLSAVVNHGNLVLMGSRNWGPVAASTSPGISAGAARAAAEGHAGQSAATVWRERLELVPLAEGENPAQVAIGEGLDHRLVWAVGLEFAGDNGRWEALVDAGSGELLAFSDTNHYVKGVRGGVLPVSNDGFGVEGTEQPGYPMPFADVLLDSGETLFTDSGGDLACAAEGSSMTTSLAGRYVAIADNCGAIAESAADPGDLDLEFGPGTDCAVPAGHSAGDTHSARTGFYEVNRIQEIARGWLPDNAWLNSQLTANMNIDDDCNAFWNGSSINFYTSGGGCRNTGEIAAVFDHEWGHGMDDNDANPAISAPGEAYADVAALLRLNTSCIGRGFDDADDPCGGNGDRCTVCTGVREVDWAKRQSGQPHDLDWVNSPTFIGRGGCVGGIFIPTQQGPCGQGTHCEGSMASEAVWDLVKRDLPAYAGAGFSIDDATAVEMAHRAFYLAGGALGNWYNCNPASTPGNYGDGCNADGAYMNFLAVDDDNGDLTDGTPHMPAIHAAFDRHQIACDQPLPTTGANCTRPTTAPQVTVTPGFKSAELTWTAVAGASEYWVFRSDGALACTFGKAKVGETMGTSFSDSGLAHDLPYAYQVIAVGSSDSCVGPASPCATVTAGAGAALDFTADEPYLVASSGGDDDPFVDNCETAEVGFSVANTGTTPLTNVRVAHVEPLSHPGLTITSTPTFANSLSSCGEADGSFEFIASGLAPNDEVTFRVDVTADELAGSVVSTVATLIAAESDFSPVASRTWSFDDGLDGWEVSSGSFSHNAGAGGNGSLGYLESSALQDEQCDQVVSPVVRLTAGSTLSLANQYVIEPGENSGASGWFDRANVGVRDVASNARDTVVPDAGRAYEASGPNGVCDTAGQPGWAGPGPLFLDSSWSTSALNPGGAYTGRIVRLDVAYGTDALVSGLGFQFDEVTLTDFEEQTADAQPDACPVTPPQPCTGDLGDDDAAVEYRKGWHRRSHAGASDGTFHRRAGKGNGNSASTARLVFDGDAVTYHYAMSNIGGTGDVYIDGVFQETVSYGPGGNGNEVPTFGHSRTYDGLGDGSHELVIEHRSGAVYVDGFEFTCESSGGDAEAVEYTSDTETHSAPASEGLVVTRTVEVGNLDRHLSVVVEGSSVPLTVQLLSPVGTLLTSGDALLAGSALSGFDHDGALTPGTYTVRVLSVLGAGDLGISIARTTVVE